MRHLIKLNEIQINQYIDPQLILVCEEISYVLEAHPCHVIFDKYFY